MPRSGAENGAQLLLKLGSPDDTLIFGYTRHIHKLLLQRLPLLAVGDEERNDGIFL